MTARRLLVMAQRYTLAQRVRFRWKCKRCDQESSHTSWIEVDSVRDDISRYRARTRSRRRASRYRRDAAKRTTPDASYGPAAVAIVTLPQASMPERSAARWQAALYADASSASTSRPASKSPMRRRTVIGNSECKRFAWSATSAVLAVSPRAPHADQSALMSRSNASSSVLVAKTRRGRASSIARPSLKRSVGSSAGVMSTPRIAAIPEPITTTVGDESRTRMSSCVESLVNSNVVGPVNALEIWHLSGVQWWGVITLRYSDRFHFASESHPRAPA
jgi:hypothetical protein